ESDRRGEYNLPQPPIGASVSSGRLVPPVFAVAQHPTQQSTAGSHAGMVWLQAAHRPVSETHADATSFFSNCSARPALDQSHSERPMHGNPIVAFGLQQK